MINIFISPSYQKYIKPDIILKCAQSTLVYIGKSDDLEINIAIRSNDMIRRLNKQFRNIDSKTDVLSFPSEEIDPDNGLRLLGDIIISFPVAKFQAEEAAIPIEDEIQLLTIHGILHLSGFDHELETGKAEMWAVQKTILELLGIKSDGMY